MKIEEVLKSELELISISKVDLSKLKRIANDFVKLLKSQGVKAEIGGSLAKNTLIKKLDSQKQDIDIFVVFDYSEDILGFEEILNKLLLPGNLRKVHGSRDYFQIDCENVLLELIPVVKNNDPERAENVTDVSLSHVKYVKSEVSKNLGISDEIKLSKAFCLANKCYGAESYIHGFSGYSLEILTIYFGGFVKFLKGIQRAKVVDPMKYFKDEREVMREINSSKLGSPIVVVDPTYKYRNVTAGLGLETFSNFLNIVKEFLRNPSLEFFKTKELDLNELKDFAGKSKATFVEIDIETDRQEGDIAGTKCKKYLDFFESELNRKEQNVLRKEFIYSGGQRAKGYLVVKEKLEINVRGPHKDLNEPVKKFLKAKGEKNVFVKSGYYYMKQNSGVKEIFNLVQKVGKEMGAWGKIIS